MRIQVELWLWLNKELRGDFQFPSEMRSFGELELEEGLTVIQLIDRLAAQYPIIGEKIFDRGKGNLFPNLSLIVTQNGQIVSPFNMEKSVLKDGYKVAVLPLYAGG
jgi:molybdopterin converting factor small subunit